MPRRVNTTDTQTKKHQSTSRLNPAAGTSSIATPFIRPRATAMGRPLPQTSAESVFGSWSAMSIPKSVPRRSTAAGTDASPLPPPPPPPPTLPLPSSSSSAHPQGLPSALKRRRVSPPEADAAVAFPVITTTTPTPTSNTSTNTNHPPTRITRRTSSPAPEPVAPRSLVPEPAPPPVGSSGRLSSKQISNSSRDRPPPHARVRRISTPYPHPHAGSASRPRKTEATRGRRRTTTVTKVPEPSTTSPLTEAYQYRPNTSTPNNLMPMSASTLLTTARRSSPVPPSSSKSDSNRSSSESYMSLKDDEAIATEPPSDSLHPPQSQSHPPNIVLSISPPQPQAPMSSSHHTLSPLIPGVPQIFNLNHHHKHVIPLPALTFPSLRGLRPTALPTTTTNAPSETIEDTGGEEYASDHPHDLKISSLLMPDELERVRLWAERVEACVRDLMERGDDAGNAGGQTPGSVEEDEIVGEAWDWEKPAKIDLDALIPGKEWLYASHSPSSGVTLSPESARLRVASSPHTTHIFKAFPFPPSLRALDRVNSYNSLNHHNVPRTAYTYTTVLSPLPAQPREPPPQEENQNSAQNQVNLGSEHGREQDEEEGVAVIVVPSSVEGLDADGRRTMMTSLVSPSPFSPLPSPFRFGIPALTPALRSKRLPMSAARAAHQQYPPPPPSSLAAPPSTVPEQDSLASPVSPRPHSPETPARLPHTSTEREGGAGDYPAGLVRRKSNNNQTRNRSRSSDGTEQEEDSRSGSGTRGRSPTRRSWKASSERHSIKNAFNNSARATAVFAQAQLHAFAMQVMRPESSAFAFGGNDDGETMSMVRPRTASRAASSRYSTDAYPPPSPPPGRMNAGTPHSLVSGVTASDFFFAPAPPGGVLCAGVASESEQESAMSSIPPDEVRLNSQSTTPAETVLAGPPPSVSGTVVPVLQRRVDDALLQPPPPPRATEGSVLRRRKSHAAPRSVVSLPSSQRSGMSRATGSMPPPMVVLPTPAVHSRRSASPPPVPRRASDPITPPAPIAPPPFIRTATAPPPRGRSGPPPSTTNNTNHTTGGSTLPRTTTTTSLAFLKLITLLTQFTSDLSTGRQGVPRWKHDCVEVHEEVQEVYEAFRESVERTRIKFRPWLRGAVSRMDEREIEEGVAGAGGNGGGEDDERPVVYLEDVADKLFGFSSNKVAASASAVQEDLIRSVVSSWDELVHSCLQGTRASLDQLVTMVVDTHFGCAGDGEELRRIVQSIADIELAQACELTEHKLSEQFSLEASSVFSVKARQASTVAASVSHYRSLRQRAQQVATDRNINVTESPIQMPFAAIPRRFSESPIKRHGSHIQSHSRDTSATTFPSSSTGKTGAGSSSVGGHPSSFASTLATSVLPGSGEGDSETAAAFTRLRRYSLLGGGESPQYEQEVKLAITTLSNLGFKDITTPERLYAKLADVESPESIDEVLEVMANVDAYLDAASTRFVDYAAMHIEHHLVNAIGERINAAVLSTLDLASDGIKSQCIQWMS